MFGSDQLHKSTKSLGGMTLIEILVTLMLAVLLMAAGIPGFVELRQSQTQSASVYKMYGLMQFARTLAITEATTVTVCASTNLNTCDGTTNFARGGVVLSANNDGTATLVRVLDRIDDDTMSIALNGFPQIGQVQFNDIGEIADLTTAGSIIFCDPRGS